MGRTDRRNGRGDGESLLLRRVSRRSRPRAAVGRLHDEPHPRAGACSPSRFTSRRCPRCSAIAAWMRSPATTHAQPRSMRPRTIRRSTPAPKGILIARVRAPHRGAAARIPRSRARTTARSAGPPTRTSARARGGRSVSPAPRTRATTAQPRRGVRRGVPRAERAEARPSAGVVDDRQRGPRTRRDALSLLEQDVTTPWTAATVKTLTAKLTSKVRTRTFVRLDALRRDGQRRRAAGGGHEGRRVAAREQAHGQGEDVESRKLGDLLDRLRRAPVLASACSCRGRSRRRRRRRSA